MGEEVVMADSGTSTRGPDVVVVGAGQTGLGCAAALIRRGLRPLVLERGADVAAAWRHRYPWLRLNSAKGFSGLPGRRYPRGTPMFPTRDQVVRYLEDVRAAAGIEVLTKTAAARIDRDDGRWRVATDAGPVTAPQVVVATGLLAVPHLPPALAPPGPPVVHAADYVDGAPYRGRDVVVVGAGSSAMEIAHDLVRGGAGRVLLSVRTPPNVLPRAVLGQSGDPAVLLLMRLPPRVADAPLGLLRRLTIGDLAPQGLPVPPEGPFVRLRRDGATPAVVDPAVLEDLRAGRVRVVPAVVGLEPGRVCLADGTQEDVDAVVAATGFRPGLEGLVGHLGVLDTEGLPTAHDEQPALPGLRFVNYRMRPGLLLAAGGRARRTADAIARELA